MKVTFLKSPTGKFKLGYSIGHTGEVEKSIAEQLIAEGYAVAVIKAAPKKTTKKTTKK